MVVEALQCVKYASYQNQKIPNLKAGMRFRATRYRIAKGTSSVEFAGVTESVSAAAKSTHSSPGPKAHGKARRRPGRHRRLLRNGECRVEVALLLRGGPGER